MNSEACGECAGSPRRLARQSHYFSYRAFLPSVLLAGQDGSSSFFSWLHQLSVGANKTYRPKTDQRVSLQQITPRIRSIRFSSFSS